MRVTAFEPPPPTPTTLMRAPRNSSCISYFKSASSKLIDSPFGEDFGFRISDFRCVAIGSAALRTPPRCPHHDRADRKSPEIRNPKSEILLSKHSSQESRGALLHLIAHL